MKLYFKYINKCRCLEIYDLNIRGVIDLLSLKDYYNTFSEQENFYNKDIEYVDLNEFFGPEFFYDFKNGPYYIRYNYILCFGIENMEKCLNFWHNNIKNNDIYIDLKENYKKYYDAAIIKEIIE